jgi:hypothetical protein
VKIKIFLVDLAKSRHYQPLSLENDYGDDDYDDDDDNDDASKVPTYCKINSSDAATRFGHERKPYSTQLQYLKSHAASCATCQLELVNCIHVVSLHN